MEKNKKRILVISQYFFPENFRINDICHEWVNRGYEVNVVTAIPNYPIGKFFEGYGIFKKRKESYNGIKITRLPIVPRGKNSLLLALNYLSFVVSGYFWKSFTKIEADFVFTFEVSPMSQALLGVWYSKKRNIPSFLYVQDLWPENVEMMSGIKSKTVLNLIGKMVDYIYGNTTKILTTSKGFIQSIHQRGVPLEKLEYLPQYAEDYYFPQENIFVPEIRNNDSFKVMFTGNVGYAQGLDILPKVAKYLLEKEHKNFEFIIVGDGRYKNELIDLVDSMQLNEYFQFIDSQLPQRIRDFLSISDCAFLCLKDNPLFSLTIPAKLQTYMACGKPIIATASGETMEIINSSRAGLCSDPNDFVTLSSNLIKMSALSKTELKKMGDYSRLYYESNFSKENFFTTLEVVFNDNKKEEMYV